MLELQHKQSLKVIWQKTKFQKINSQEKNLFLSFQNEQIIMQIILEVNEKKWDLRLIIKMKNLL